MRDYGKDEYTRSLREMQSPGPFEHADTIILEEDNYTEFSLSRPQKRFSLSWDDILAFVLLGTLVPILPFLLWALLASTDFGEWVRQVDPFNLHPLLESYTISGLILLVLLIPQRLSVVKRKKAEHEELDQPEMSEEQAIFLCLVDALEALRAYEVNKLESHLRTARSSLHKVTFYLESLDPRDTTPPSNLVQIPDSATERLDLLMNATKRVLGILRNPGSELQDARRTIDLMQLGVYSLLPDVPKLIGQPLFDELSDLSSEAWSSLERVARQLPNPPPDEEHEPQKAAEPHLRHTLFRLLVPLLVDLFLALLLAFILVAPIAYFVSLYVGPSSQDALKITAMVVLFSFTAAIATTLHNRRKVHIKD